MHTEIHTETHETHEAAEPDSEVKVEPVDPLAMDMGDDEVDYEPEKLNIEVREPYINKNTQKPNQFLVYIYSWHERKHWLLSFPMRMNL